MLELGGVLVGLVLLFFGGNWLVEGASRLARSLGISPLVVLLVVLYQIVAFDRIPMVKKYFLAYSLKII